MKHPLVLTISLIALFLCSQLVGLVVVNKYIDYEKTVVTGNVSWKELPSVGGIKMERPELEENTSFIWIILAVIAGTALLLLLIKWKKFSIWKIWFFIAVVLCLTIAFAAFLPAMAAFAVAVILTLIKLFRPNFVVHNFTELFIYGGLAVIFVPVINMFAMIALLILISIYDAYAVWKSGHMVTMAKFQAKTGIFAGLLLPYSMRLKKAAGEKAAGVRTAVLGGGDMGFPLLFAGVVLKSSGIYTALIIPLFVTAALLGLLLLGKKGRFYPAMPFLSAGCILGYLIVLVL